MAKKRSLGGDEADLSQKIRTAIDAWHEDRKVWSERAMRSLMLVNSGGAVAAAAFIGTALGRPQFPMLDPPYLPFSLMSFVLGLGIIVGHSVFRYFWAEYRVWNLRWKKRELWDDTKTVALKTVKTQRPPTRPQLWIIYIANGLSFLFFVTGVLLGSAAIMTLPDV